MLRAIEDLLRFELRSDPVSSSMQEGWERQDQRQGDGTEAPAAAQIANYGNLNRAVVVMEKEKKKSKALCAVGTCFRDTQKDGKAW